RPVGRRDRPRGAPRAPARAAPPGPEAVEHPPGPRRPAARDRLRAGPEAGGRRRVVAVGLDRGDAPVHEPRAGVGHEAGDHDGDGWGAILYAGRPGSPPFQAESVPDTLAQVRGHEPEPPSRLNPRVPRDLEVICLKCLEKDPRRRYDSAAALADELERFERGE